MLRKRPTVIFDPMTVNWTTGDTPNKGSIPGRFALLTGVPTRGAGALNGRDVINFSSSGLYLPSAAMPSGNMFFFYVAKQTGAPPNGGGSLAGQYATTPGWFLMDSLNASGSLSNGDSYVAGDSMINGWPPDTITTSYDQIVTLPANSNYRITACKIGTEAFWQRDGVTYAAKFLNTNTITGTTSDLNIGTSGSPNNYHWIGSLAYYLQAQDPSPDEVVKLFGWAAWEYRLQANLPLSHKFRGTPPMATAEDTMFMADSGLYVPRRKLIVPNGGWRIAA